MTAPSPGGQTKTFDKTFDLFIGGLPGDITQDYLVQHFSKFGLVHSATLAAGKRNDGSQICFIRYVNRDEAVKAIQENVTFEYNGIPIRVNAAQRNGSCWYKDLKAEKAAIKMPHEGLKVQKRSHGGHIRANGAGDVMRKEELITSHHESPVVFWAQRVDRSGDLKELTEQLQQVCPGGQSLTAPANMDKIYATMYSVDCVWYRCRVLRHISETQVEVAFIDFGNTEIKTASEIKELLPNLANIKPLSQRYCLYGLRAVHDSDTAGFQQGLNKIIELTDERKLAATVYNTNEMAAIPVILEAKTETGVVDINQEILSSGFAICVPKKNEQLNRPPSGHHRQWLPPIPPDTAQNQNSNAGNIAYHKHRQINTLNNNNNDFQNMSIRIGSGDSQAAGEIMRLRQALEKSQMENRQQAMHSQHMNEAKNQETAVIKQEWDNAVAELKTAKMTIIKEREGFALLNKKYTEQSLPQRLMRLVQSVERVKSYRIQFPTEEHKEDPIEKAFTVANDPGKIRSRKLPMSDKVEQAVKVYDATQNAIRACENAEELPALIGTRDHSRINLHVNLTAFLEEAQKLPLEERSEEVEKALTMILKTYSDLLKENIAQPDDLNSFDEALHQYREWKNQKVIEFQEARTKTNTSHNGVNNALRILQEQLSLDTGTCGDSVSTLTGLDSLLDGFQEAVDEEAHRTDMVSGVNEADAMKVGALLRVLEAELKCELKDIIHLRKQTVESMSYANHLSAWLEEKPQVEPIISVRKQIKSLKSKLRHKLADLQDLEEESEDSSNEEKIRIKAELGEIRSQLHKAFIEEDERFTELADLNETHFPELSIQHPDLAIDTVKEYNGLMKQGRALDQFSTEPMPHTKKKNIMKAVFNDKDCVLKEYIIDEGVGVRKTEFLRRAMYYSEIINPHIMCIDALFFTGAGRQVYVQLPYYEKNLTQLIEEGPLCMEYAYHILSKVLIGLQAIHSANLVFGALHPNNVLISPDRHVVLSELDFSKSPGFTIQIYKVTTQLSWKPRDLYDTLTNKHQRTGTFMTKSRLLFQSPEYQKQEISWASDMFNFGLLALWLHFPSYKFSVRPNGVPDFSPLEMDRKLEQLLVSLLQEEPASRCMASSIWKLAYFCNSLHSQPASPKTPGEEETLQLRRKSDPQTNAPKDGHGILKNKGTMSPTSSPIHSPQVPQKDLLKAIEEVRPEIMNESTASTPDLVCSPQGTPVNTPAEIQSEDTSPPDSGSFHVHIDKTTGLVKDAMLQASKLADMQPHEDREAVLGDINGMNSKMSILDEVAKLEADIMAQTSALPTTQAWNSNQL